MKKVVYWAIGIAVSGLLLALFLYFLKFGDSGLGNQEAFALFGDFIGGVLSPILGFATILILLRSLWLQNEEMKASREELRNTREEMVATREVHSNDLELQARNHLRPQLKEAFKESSIEFTTEWKKRQTLFSFFELVATSTSFEELHTKITALPDANYREAWDHVQNRYAAFRIRQSFSALWQSAVALVEYSDTSLETDKVRRIFIDALQKMLNLDLQDEVRLTEELDVLDSAIQDRKNKIFPVFHQAIKT